MQLAVEALLRLFWPSAKAFRCAQKKMQGWAAEGEERAKLPSPVLSKSLLSLYKSPQKKFTS